MFSKINENFLRNADACAFHQDQKRYEYSFHIVVKNFPKKIFFVCVENSTMKYCPGCQHVFSTSSGGTDFGGRTAMRMGGESTIRPVKYPAQIAEHLDQYVVGQQLAKKALAVGVYQHYRWAKIYNLLIRSGSQNYF